MPEDFNLTPAMSAFLGGDASAMPNNTPPAKETESPENVAPSGASPKPTEEVRTEAPKPDENPFAWADGLVDLPEKTPEAFRAAIEKERADYNDKIRLLSEAPTKTFHNDNIRKYNDFVKETGIENPSVFSKVSNMNIKDNATVEELVDVIITKQILDDPSKIEIESALRSKLMSQYGTDLGEDATEEEKRDRLIDLNELKERAKTAKAALTDLLGKLEGGAPKSVDLEALKSEKEARAEKWQLILNQGSEQLKFAIPKVEVKDGIAKETGESFYEANFDANQKEGYKSHFNAFLQYKGVPELNEAALKEAHTYAYSQTLLESIPKLVADAHARGISEAEKRNATESTNPSAVNAEQKVNSTVNTNQVVQGLVDKVYGG